MKWLWVIQHAPHEHPGVIGELLRAHGVEFRLARPFLGESLPDSRQVSGLISLGGPMSSNDEGGHPWIRAELDLIRGVIGGELPFLGICLGAQLACRALGGKVVRLPDPEIGWHGVEKTTEGASDPLLAGLDGEFTVYQWHYESFDMPRDGVRLLRSGTCLNQAWRLGTRAYGCQFHPEVDGRLLEEWLLAPGSEDELSQARKKHGETHVQSALEQRIAAGVGVPSNRRVAEALVRLFVAESRGAARQRDGTHD